MTAKEMAENAKTKTIIVGEPVRVAPQKDSQMATSDVYLFEADEFQQFCAQLCREQLHYAQQERDKRSMYVDGVWYVACDDIEKSEKPEI
jgi:hypothetical protein